MNIFSLETKQCIDVVETFNKHFSKLILNGYPTSIQLVESIKKYDGYHKYLVPFPSTNNDWTLCCFKFLEEIAPDWWIGARESNCKDDEFPSTTFRNGVGYRYPFVIFRKVI